jgi:hypothetical protein
MVNACQITDSVTYLFIPKATALNEKKAAGPSEAAANLRTGGVS